MIKANNNGGHSIFCDCCGNQKLGEVREDKVIIMDRRHGKKHIAVVSIAELSRLAAEAGLTKSASEV